MVAMYQFSITVGVLVAYFTNEYFRILSENTAANPAGSGLINWLISDVWRIMLGSEVIPAVLFLILLFFVPRSPRFAASIGKKAEGLRILTKINGPELASREIIEIEKAIQKEKGTFSQLFKPGLRKATYITLFSGHHLSVERNRYHTTFTVR